MVVTVSAGVLTVMLSAAVVVAFAESLTWTVKLVAPEVVGVPEIAPLGSRDKPAGSAPAVIDH